MRNGGFACRKINVEIAFLYIVGGDDAIAYLNGTTHDAHFKVRAVWMCDFDCLSGEISFRRFANGLQICVINVDTFPEKFREIVERRFKLFGSPIGRVKPVAHINRANFIFLQFGGNGQTGFCIGGESRGRHIGEQILRFRAVNTDVDVDDSRHCHTEFRLGGVVFFRNFGVISLRQTLAADGQKRVSADFFRFDNYIFEQINIARATRYTDDFALELATVFAVVAFVGVFAE